nr:trehalose-6-phosphate synthase [Desulfobulbus sp.]
MPCSIDNNGVLILSEFTGAAAQLHNGALLVNPFDIVGTGDAIRRACFMDEGSRRNRMVKMRRAIQRHDIFQWVNAFLRTGIHKDLDQFPRVELFLPTTEHCGAHGKLENPPSGTGSGSRSLSRQTPSPDASTVDFFEIKANSAISPL